MQKILLRREHKKGGGGRWARKTSNCIGGKIKGKPSNEMSRGRERIRTGLKKKVSYCPEGGNTENFGQTCLGLIPAA